MMKKKLLKYGKQIVVVCILIFAFLGLFVRTLGDIADERNISGYPDGGLTSNRVVRIAYEEKEYLSEYYVCETLPYFLRVPGQMDEKKNCLVGKMDGVTYLIMESSEDLDSLMQGQLPKAVNTPVLGYVPEYKEAVSKAGFLYEWPAEYCAGEATTKISVREVTTYAVAYSISFGKDVNLILYASAEEKQNLYEAEEVLRWIILSAENLPDVEDEDSAGTEDLQGEEPLFEIYEGVENEYVLTNGVCVFEWVNSTTVPDVIYIDKGNSASIMPDMELSIPGEYVFVLGECTPGTYKVRGYTSGAFYDVRILFMEYEKYLAKKEASENSEYAAPRYDEDE